LSNPVSGVNVIDNCDVLRWTAMDEIIITSGFCFKDDENAQIQIVKDLKQARCSCLGVKVNRFFDHLPQCMIDTANAVGLPLVEIPYYYRFTEIVTLVDKAISADASLKRNLAPDIFRKLTEIYYSEPDIKAMISALSEALGEIVILTQLMDISAYHIPDAMLKDFIPASGSTEIIEVSRGNSEDDKQSYFSINGKTLAFAPIALPNKNSVLLLSADIPEEKKEAAEYCLSILALALENGGKSEKKVMAQNHFDLFYSMLMDEQSRNSGSLQDIYDYYGFDFKKKRVCITIQLKDEYADKINALTKELTQKLTEMKTNFFMCFHLSFINIFVLFPVETSVAVAVSTCIEIGKELYETVNDFLEQKPNSSACIVGVGRCHKRVNTVSAAFQDSMQTIRLSVFSAAKKKVYTYFSQTSHHVLLGLNPEEVKKIYDDSVKQLAEYDAENESELVPTLRAYLSCNCNTTETAKKLFLHRNTLANRLNKIKTILCVDMNDSEEIFALHLALCAMDLLKKN
ncbi:MAG: PucR family transcriptional regulator, partial [Oscillospiraceae bacterium]